MKKNPTSSKKPIAKKTMPILVTVFRKQFREVWVLAFIVARTLF
jgi:hypothetical protein